LHTLRVPPRKIEHAHGLENRGEMDPATQRVRDRLEMNSLYGRACGGREYVPVKKAEARNPRCLPHPGGHARSPRGGQMLRGGFETLKPRAGAPALQWLIIRRKGLSPESPMRITRQTPPAPLRLLFGSRISPAGRIELHVPLGPAGPFDEFEARCHPWPPPCHSPPKFPAGKKSLPPPAKDASARQEGAILGSLHSMSPYEVPRGSRMSSCAAGVPHSADQRRCV
jgi:hypothetical protein